MVFRDLNSLEFTDGLKTKSTAVFGPISSSCKHVSQREIRLTVLVATEVVRAPGVPSHGVVTVVHWAVVIRAHVVLASRI